MCAYLEGDPASWTAGQATRNHRMNVFMQALQQLGSLTQVFSHTDFPETTVIRWRRDHPKFADAINTFITDTRITRIEEAMYRIATSTDPKMANAAVRAQETLLKAYDRPRFGDHLTTESTQTVNHLVQVVHTVRDGIKARQQEALQRLKTIDAEPEALPSTEE